MKIVSCFSRISEIRPLARAGADELYCAVDSLPYYFGEPSSRGRPSALPDLDSLRAAVSEAHSLGRRIAVALNHETPEFLPSREKALVRALKRADRYGVDAFIVSSPAIFELLGRAGVRAERHLSSVQPCFNSLAAEFFIRLGASRIILPNQLAPAEAGKLLALCRTRGVAVEVFDYRFFGCTYINGRCRMHSMDDLPQRPGTRGDSMCRMAPRPGDLSWINPVWTAPGRRRRIESSARRLAAGLTGSAPALADAGTFFDYFSAGVQYLKYGTRSDGPEVKAAKVRRLRAMLDLAEWISGKLPPEKARRLFIEKISRWNGETYR